MTKFMLVPQLCMEASIIQSSSHITKDEFDIVERALPLTYVLNHGLMNKATETSPWLSIDSSVWDSNDLTRQLRMPYCCSLI